MNSKKYCVYSLAFFVMTFAVLPQGQAQSVERTECNVVYDETRYFYKINECNEEGQVVLVKEFFAESDVLSSEIFLDDRGRKVKRITYSSQGGSSLKIFEYSKNTVTETTYHQNSDELVKAKVERTLKTNKKIKSWEYEDFEPIWIDHFTPPNEKQITKRQFLNEDKVYHLFYRPESRYGDEIERFVVTDNKGKALGEYRYEFDGDVEKVLKHQFSGHELDAKLTNFRNSERIPVAIIDSGFDFYHPAITPYLYNHPVEVWDSSVDLDGNGLPGDVLGWSTDVFGQGRANINEPVIIGSFKPHPMSHGTHVASIAMKDLKGVAMLGYAGDVGNPEHLKMISQELSVKNIRLANMSWGFKEMGAPLTPGTRTYVVLKKMITQNPQTLFHVAAGNSGWDLDAGHEDYPASYSHNNLLVVGALNEDDYNWKNSENLRPGIFQEGLGSNTGVITVDVFAPGKEVLGAQLGGGMIKKSGTSMASPYALNTTSSVLKILPSLTTVELKKLIMKSVGYPEEFLPCVSRGFVHPKRAIAAAKLMAEDPSLSIEQAILKVREVQDHYYPGEVRPSRAQLSLLWKAVDSSFEH